MLYIYFSIQYNSSIIYMYLHFYTLAAPSVFWRLDPPMIVWLFIVQLKCGLRQTISRTFEPTTVSSRPLHHRLQILSTSDAPPLGMIGEPTQELVKTLRTF